MTNVKMLIIGVGNEFQHDDGIGRVIARKLNEIKPHNVTIIEESGEATSLMDAWKCADKVIIIDAMVSGKPPGTIVRFDAAAKPLPQDSFPRFSTHSFSIYESIELARVLKRLPSTTVVFGIEGASFDSGQGLSPAVERAATVVIDQILEEISE